MAHVGSSRTGIRGVEVAVVGAGIVGLAAADALARSGVNVVCLERGAPGSGQSAGMTRIFRHLHWRPELVGLAREARAGWAEWESRAGRRLIGDEGTLLVDDDLEGMRARLASAGLESRIVDRAGQAEALPVLGPGVPSALLDPGGGAIRTRRAVGALTGWLGPRLAQAEVVGLSPEGSGVLVQATEGLWRAERALVCAGARTPELARALGVDLPVTSAAHVRATFAVRPEHRDARLACWIDLSGATGEPVYGGPMGTSGSYVIGLADHEADPPVAVGATMPAGADLRPAVRRLGRYAERAFPGLDPEPVGLRVCVTTGLPWHRDAFACWTVGPVTLFAGNNLFKHAPALGRLLAEAVTSGRIPPLLAPGP
jgi:sarcosine oxidase